MTLPNDPVMLLSYVNTQLRDFYPTFSEFCLANDLNSELIIQKLATIDYAYNTDTNQFI